MTPSSGSRTTREPGYWKVRTQNIVQACQAPLLSFNPLSLAATIWLFLLFLTQKLPIVDFGWQVATGEIIARTWRIPQVDPFSWSAPGAPFVVHEWLPDLFFYLAWTHFPPLLLLLYKALCGVVIVGLIAFRARRRSGSHGIALATAFISAAALRDSIDIRPGNLTLILTAGLFLILDLRREGRGTRTIGSPGVEGSVPDLIGSPLLVVQVPARDRAAGDSVQRPVILFLLLPLIFALWSNLHGGVAVGLALLALVEIGDALDRSLGLRAAGDTTVRQTPDSPRGDDAGKNNALVSTALRVLPSAVACGLNPNGFGILAYPFTVLGHPTVADNVMEWRSPDFHHGTQLLYEILLLGGLAAFGATRRRRMADLLPMLAAAHASLIAVRNVGLYVVVAAPILAEAVGRLREDARLRSPAPDAGPKVRTAFSLAATFLFLCGSAALWPRGIPANWFREYGMLDTFPEAAADRLAAGEWPGRIYNDYGWGGYLIQRLHPRRKVFIDGRAEVYYPSGIFDDAETIAQVRPGWKARLDRLKIATIITARDGRLATTLDENAGRDWKRVFTGRREVVYVRSQPGRRTPAMSRSG